jgi:hypothetical protein
MDFDIKLKKLRQSYESKPMSTFQVAVICVIAIVVIILLSLLIGWLIQAIPNYVSSTALRKKTAEEKLIVESDDDSDDGSTVSEDSIGTVEREYMAWRKVVMNT